MQATNFKTRIKQFDFENADIENIKNSTQGEDWPVVYVLSGDKEAYIGETQNAYERMKQHKNNPERKTLTKISLMTSDSFNKSAILDIENMLITHMHADGKFKLQNLNGGQSKLHNYYQRALYQDSFSELRKQLKRHGLVDHDLFEVQNTEIFKYSPFKQLTNEQYSLVNNLVANYIDSLSNTSRQDVIVNGAAGTGKTLVAIYFINLLIGMYNGQYDISDIDHIDDSDSFAYKYKMIKAVQNGGPISLALVEPVPAFRETVKKIFKSVKELKHIKVISPSEACDKKYDVIVVDEAHRLKRRVKLANNGTHIAHCNQLRLPIDSTELDWLKVQANKLLILFYDHTQQVKESDVSKEDFDKIIDKKEAIKYFLRSQLRVKGGNEYINFVKSIFKDKPLKYEVTNGYDFKIYDSFLEMMNEIKNKNNEYDGLCRIVSGLCFNKRMKVRDNARTNYNQDFDFEIEGIKLCWNENFNDSSFINGSENIDKIGCLYTCQGYDLNVAGVIIGPDVRYSKENDCIEFDVSKFIDKNSKSDDINKTISNIKHAYEVLLTRGIYGTYVYAYDDDLREYLKSLVLKKA